MLLQCGALGEGAATVLAWGEKGCQLARQTPDIWIDGARVAVVWDEPMAGAGRPWFECPACGRRCRYVYLRDVIVCRTCHRLDYASRHLHPGGRSRGRAALLTVHADKLTDDGHQRPVRHGTGICPSARS